MQVHTTPSTSNGHLPDDEWASLLPFVKHRRDAVRERPRIAAIYARESDPALQDSIPGQLDDGRRYAERNGLPVRYEYSDGVSGRVVAREDYQRMLDDAEAQVFTDLILWESPRFGRVSDEFIRAMRRLMALGIRIHALDKGRELKADEVARLAAEAEEESYRNARRTRDKQRGRAEKGEVMGRLPLGLKFEYEHDKRTGRITKRMVVLDPDYALAMQRAFHDYAAGRSRAHVTAQFNADTGLSKTPAEIGWMLKNPKYCGCYIWGKTSCGKVTGTHPNPEAEWAKARIPVQLIDEETWKAVQVRLADHTHHGHEHPKGRGDLLTGFLWCGACGKRMWGHTRRQGGRAFEQYVCQHCNRARKMAVIDEMAVNELHRSLRTPLVPHPDLSGLEVPRPEPAASLVDELEARLKAITAERVELTRLHAQHKIESEDYHAALAVTDGERAALKEQLREVRARVQQAQAERAAMAALIAKYKRRLAGDENGEGTVFCFAGPDECRQVLADFVERIVYDRASDTITVAYKPRLAQWQQEMAQLFDDEQDYSVRAILGPG